MIDPDNRRPVDYAARLTVQQEKSEDWNLMYHRWPDGAVKQQLVQVLLQHRKANRGLYGYGNYVPLTVQGEGGSQWLAFMRCHEGHTLLVAIRCVATGELLPAEIMWEAQQPATRWRNVLTQQELKLEGTRLSLSCGVADLPVVVLEAVA